jgi:hypothetical protein
MEMTSVFFLNKNKGKRFLLSYFAEPDSVIYSPAFSGNFRQLFKTNEMTSAVIV